MLRRPNAILAVMGPLTVAGVVASLIVACGGVGGQSSKTLGSSNGPGTVIPASVPLSPTPPAPVQTALRIPVTPVAVTYQVADPVFSALPGAKALYGVHQGAGYQIEVPENWNGELVLYAHGYHAYDPSLTVDQPALRQHFIENDYAWAASSYQTNGYSVGVGAEDTRLLAQLFAELVGEPSRTYLYGNSLGAHVTTFLMERYPSEFDGALAECGAVAGVAVLDYFASWSILAAYLTGVEGGIDIDPDSYLAAITEIDVLLGPADSPTIAGTQFESAVSELSGGRRPFLHEGYLESRDWNFLVTLDAYRNPEMSIAAASNEDERYTTDSGLGLTADELNRTIPRLAANPDVRAGERFPEFNPVTGRIEAPYLTLHNTGDLFVPISQEQIYRRAVEDTGRSDLLVQRAIRRPGHCAFRPPERQRAFDDLVRWVETGFRPAGDDLLGDLMDAGLEFTDPLHPDDPGTP